MFYSSFAITVTSSHTPAHDIMKPIIKDVYRNDWKMTQWHPQYETHFISSNVWSLTVINLSCLFKWSYARLHRACIALILNFLMNNDPRWRKLKLQFVMSISLPLSSYLFTALNPPGRQWRSSVRSITDQHERSSKELFWHFIKRDHQRRDRKWNRGKNRIRKLLEPMSHW